MDQDARTKLLPFPGSPEVKNDLPPIDINVPEAESSVSLEDGALKVENSDGSVEIDLNPDLSEKDEDGGFDENLAKRIAPEELARITGDLLAAIDADNSSRSKWLETRARGITLLGLELEEPRSELGSGSMEGMSTVRHPLLLEATLRFQANARGELLPASGPVKVRNDTPTRPEQPRPAGQPIMPQGMPPGMPPMMNGMNGAAPPVPPDQTMEGNQPTEDLADALEKDFNHYLTVDAPEYYPDTDRMLFYVGFGGLGIKKVYNCPLRRRPVSESVDADDLIVSNAVTDLRNAGRITHVIKMRPSVLKRMQIVGAYRDVSLIGTSVVSTPTPVEKKIEEIQGTQASLSQIKPEDIDQVIYESYCELDIAGFEHKDEDNKITGLHCPYKVVIHKDSRQILELRRNWKEDDPLAMPRPYFVNYQFAPGLGFYPIGLIHILGNTTTALTAAWRVVLDGGMFANFPGFLYNKMLNRQLTNNIRIPPGGGFGIDVGGQDIRSAVLPLPYKDAGVGFVGFLERVEELGTRVGGTADAAVGEGKQEVPVGTTLALIEQATKVMDAVHKRLHAAQAEEFNLLKERFKEDPEAFWRHNKKPTIKWQREQFLQALDNSMVVPVADPNNPTSLHRIMKALAIKELQSKDPLLYDRMAVDKRVMRVVNIDPEGLFLPTPADPAPDPRMEAVKSKERIASGQTQAQAQSAGLKVQEAQMKMVGAEKDRQAKMTIAQQEHAMDQERLKQEHQLKMTEMMEELKIKQQEMQMELQKTQSELQAQREESQIKLQSDHAMNQQKLQMTDHQHSQDMEMQGRQMEMDAHSQEQKAQSDQAMQRQSMGMEREKHQMGLQAQREKHDQTMQSNKEQSNMKMKQADAMGQQKVQTAKAIAKAKGGAVKKK